MIKIILPIVITLIGLAAGVGAGLFLRPAEEAQAGTEHEPNADHATETAKDQGAPEVPPEYVKMSNQFIVPLVKNDRISAMVILSLSLEVAPESAEQVFAREPKLRDSFLQIMFDHANTGGFAGSFTEAENLTVLREGLKQAAHKIFGDLVSDVLITDIVRQDG